VGDGHILIFEPFRVDIADERLWRGEDAVHLTNKAFAVLRYLAEHPAQLVTKDALLDAVWPDTVVSESAMSVCIREIRQALGDDARAPAFIETVRGRGYRFLAPVTIVVDRSRAAPRADAPGRPTPRSASRSGRSSCRGPIPLVGRETELAQLHQWFATALGGERRVGFVSGEAGIGKTTLVDAFVACVGNKEALWIGHGQCVDQYGAGEGYLPLLEALGRLCRGPEGEPLLAHLRQQAPSWLVQMPALLGAAERAALERSEGGATQARMLRELAEAIELLTAERPLVLVLEDLHWSDASTLAWLGYVARRREAARLLVLATYRPVEAIVADHPLRTLTQELRRHGQCEELALDYLSEAAVAAYLTERRPGPEPPAGLARTIYQRTDGNPLFLVTLVDTLVQQGTLEAGPTGWNLPGGLEAVRVGVPESLRQLIEQQIEQVPPEEQTILEAASVVGAEFSAAAVAAGVEGAAEAVETHCAALARRAQFLEARGTASWPDGTIAARYGFIHALYQEVLYHRVPAGQQVRLHQQIGERLEVGYGGQTSEIAAELAVHFLRGRDAPRAVQYWQQAGQQARQRSAHVEAIYHFTQGLELLETLPETPERFQQSLTLQIALGNALSVTKGFAAPEVEQAYGLARVLCDQVGETPQRFRALYGLWTFYWGRAAYQTARELGEQLLRLAKRQSDPTAQLTAHLAQGTTLFYLGKFVAAHKHLTQGLSLVAPQEYRVMGIFALIYAALTGWMRGYPDQARATMAEALTRAQQRAHPPSLAVALVFAAMLHFWYREWQVFQERTDDIIRLATEQEFAHWAAVGAVWRGWGLATQEHDDEGITRMRSGLEQFRATGLQAGLPYHLTVLVEAYGHSGQPAQGLNTLDEIQTLVDTTGDRWWEAEVWRLKGKLLLDLSLDHVAEAETCFHQALDVASRQQAKSLELRAATSLARLWSKQAKRHEARQLLARVHSWFTEGFDTADLKEAKALLEELGG
jgi:DNA-binding winged helix-turn-helix (wHTH) protein/predicted ATPase